jgi:putative nucleotidyltransferase with HDIG domain
MTTLDVLRAGVRKSFPELAEITDPSLRDKIVDAWALSLSQSEFTSIEQIRPSGNPTTRPMKRGTQTDHIRGVTAMAVAMADALEQVVGPLGINRDLLMACGLCHDLGKPFEFSPKNQARWRKNPAAAGYPSIRHSVYGVHIALSVGLPEAVAHTAGAHSGEGELITRSLENTIVHYADHAFWQILERGDRLEAE